MQQLPEHFGPERPSAVLQQAVQACIDCAHQQKLVFSLVKQGYGGEMVSGKALGQVGGGRLWSLCRRKQPFSGLGDRACDQGLSSICGATELFMSLCAEGSLRAQGEMLPGLARKTGYLKPHP